jgi:WD40 repeat protein
MSEATPEARAAFRVERGRQIRSGYDAFISYSHAMDSKLAPALRHGLHRFPRPWFRPRSARVFFDSASLTANPDLWASIVAALRTSRCLVLLASPEAAKSRWVGQEIDFWRSERPGNPLILVLTSGEIVWGGTDFDWSRTNAVPKQLAGFFAHEPLWLDLSWMRTSDQLSLRDPRFRDAIATLAAVIHDRPKDELIGEDIRQSRRQIALAAISIVLLAVLVVAATVFGGIARHERNVAREQANIAVSRELAADAESLRTSDPGTSLMLSVEALRRTETAEARSSLVTTLSETRYLGVASPASGEGQVERLSTDRDGRHWATMHGAMASGSVTFQELTDDGQVKAGCQSGAFGDQVTTVDYSPNQALVAVHTSDTGLSLWDTSDPCKPSRVAVVDPHDKSGKAIFSRQRGLLYSVGTATLYDISEPANPEVQARLVEAHDASFTHDGETLVTTLRPGFLHVWDIMSPSSPREMAKIRGSERVEFAADGRTLALINRDEPVTLWQLSSDYRLNQDSTLTTTNAAAFDVAISSDGQTLVSGNYDSTASIWNIADPARPVQTAIVGGHKSAVLAVSFLDGDNQLLTGDLDGQVIRWSVRKALNPTPLATLSGYEGAPEQLGFTSGANPALVIACGLKFAELWDLSTPAKPTKLSTITTESSGVSNLSVGGTLAILVDNDSHAGLWDLTEPRSPRKLTSVNANSASLSRDGRVMVTIDPDDRASIWTLNDPANPLRLATFGAAEISVGRLSPDTRIAPILADNGKSQLWDISEPTHPKKSASVDAFQVSWSPDSRTLATSADPESRLWDFASKGTPVLLSRFPTVHASDELVFDPSGHLLATGNEDGAPALWDVGNLRQPVRLATLTGHHGSVYRMAFSPDGAYLVTGSYDRTATVWTVATGAGVLNDPIKRACDLAGPGMSREAWDRYLPGTAYRESCP